MTVTSTARAAIGLIIKVGPLDAVATASLGLVSGIAPVPASWLTRRLVDELSRPTFAASPMPVAAIAATTMFVAGLGAAAAYASSITGTRLEAKAQLATETALAAACASYVSTKFLDDPKQHDSLQLARRGAHDAPRLLPAAIVEVVSSVAAIGGFALILAVSWPMMALAMTMVTVPAALVQRNISLRAVRVAESSTASYRWRDYYSNLFTSHDSAHDMRLFGLEHLFLDRLRLNLSSALSTETRQQNRAAACRFYSPSSMR